MSSTNSAILTDLVRILTEIPGMERSDVRSSLLSNGFTLAERSMVRKSDDMLTDLINIVNLAADLGKLNELIDNAKIRPQSQESRNRLDAILSRSKSGQPEKVSQFDTYWSEFDVFLAHNSEDKPLVEAIAEKLKQRGLNPWLDKEQIPPGRWFQDVIQQAITTVKSAAIFIGPKGLGKWQRIELRTFISQCVEADLPVIPVLLPGVSDIPKDLPFFKELNWVRFSSGIDDPEALDNLEWGITGKHPRKS